ncbi:hypothetical protein [Sagittula salina]|uniref:Uncharacterized protein n=1 Tax=Sagittula salina TaxID=2820268 RepID=A0A940MQP9_9RHOB|nr:hypothetical protein [Sagittula salina]MBP0483232.1 hypothetical protein [Sagittula salina]
MSDARACASLSPEKQLALREAYGHDPACLTGICSLDGTIAHVTEWLAARCVAFSAEVLKR